MPERIHNNNDRVYIQRRGIQRRACNDRAYNIQVLLAHLSTAQVLALADADHGPCVEEAAQRLEL